MKIVDISSKYDPRVVRDLDIPGEIYKIRSSGEYLYLACGPKGVTVLNVSNPDAPRIHGQIDTPGNAKDVFVLDGYAYVADSSKGIQVIDVANPANPKLVGALDTPGSAKGIYVSGDFAYIADYSRDLQVIDVSDPKNPDGPYGAGEVEGAAGGVYVSGEYAYLACGGQGLRFVDILNPKSPEYLLEFDTTGLVEDVWVSGSYLYLADDRMGSVVIDVSDVMNVRTVLQECETPGRAVGLYVSGDYVFVADTFGLMIFSAVPVSYPEQEFKVERVIDGDTIVLSDGREVRYIGIDAPEEGKLYFAEATEANRRLVEGKSVELELDAEEKDKYGRTLAYVYADDTFVNLKLVQDGYARAYPFPPNVRYRDLFALAEQEARRKCLGIWESNCDVDEDGLVGIPDLIIAATHFGEKGPDLPGDVDGDGEVGILDLVMIGNRCGKN